MLLSPHLKKKLIFLNENTFTKNTVGVTCETCSVKNCDVRVAEPIKLEKRNRHKEIANTVDKIINSYQ
jgi:hypothetical protein